MDNSAADVQQKLTYGHGTAPFRMTLDDLCVRDRSLVAYNCAEKTSSRSIAKQRIGVVSASRQLSASKSHRKSPISCVFISGCEQRSVVCAKETRVQQARMKCMFYIQ